MLAGPDKQGWNKGQRPWSSQVRCRQAWKTDWTQGWGRGWQPQVIQFFKKIITQIGLSGAVQQVTLYSPAALTLSGVEDRDLPGQRLGSVLGSGTLVMRVGCGHRISYPIVKQLRAEHEGIRGHMKPGRPLGTWPETSFKVLWTLLPHAPPPRNPPIDFPPPAAVLASKGCVNTGDMSSGGQGDSSHPGQGMMGQASTCPPPPQSLWWEQGLGGAFPLATTLLISGSPGGGWSHYCPRWGSGPYPGAMAGPQTHLQERGL